MPDLVQVRVDAHAPPQDQRIVFQGIDEIFQKNGPLKYLRVAFYPQFAPTVLGNGQNILADRIAGVGDEVELKNFAILLQKSIVIFLPAEAV